MTKPIKRNLFEKRLEIFPAEYPEFAGFVDAIHHSYWLFTEYNYDSDIQHFKTKLKPHEKEAITRCMLAISQIEVNVKRFWGDVYYLFPKPEIDEVGATFMDSECYSEDTEILTDKGWVKFPDLKYEDRVAAYKLNNGIVYYENPISIISKDYKGYMHHYSSKVTDILVTPNHELWFKQLNKPDYSFKRKSSEMMGSTKNYGYPVSAYLTGSKFELTDLEKLLIAIQADGVVFENCPSLKGTGTTRCSIAVSKSRKKERVELLLNQLNIKYTKSLKVKDDPRFKNCVNYDFHLGELFKDFDKIKNFGWIDSNEMTTKWCQLFIEELANWDAHISKDGQIVYYNANLEAIDKVQEIALFAGYRATKGINRTKEAMMKMPLPTGKMRKSAKDIYRLGLVKRKWTTYPDRPNKEYYYDGKVYCAEVSTGMIVTRRNGKVTINGNCRHLQAYRHLLERMGLVEVFQNVRNIPALMARINYMENFTKNKNLSQTQSVLSLVLFSLFIEHVSLFSQFLTINAFNKYRNEFKGINNAIEATSKEEELHGRFGIELFKIIAVEHHELLTPEFYQHLEAMAEEAFKAEMGIVDWIFEEGELSFISKETVKNYIKKRYNNSLVTLGLGTKYEVDEKLYKEVEWFDIEVLASKENDFFNKRSIDYTKFAKSVSGDDLF